jgi:hypothetical protein
MQRNMKNKTKFTHAECIKDAQNFITMAQWWVRSPYYYWFAKKKNWLAICGEHIVEAGTWTAEDCLTVAQRFELRSQ